MRGKRKEPVWIDGWECWECSTCGIPKRRDEFWKESKSFNGIGSQCKQCHYASRDARKAIVREQGRRWAQRNKDQCLVYKQQQRAEKPSVFKARDALNDAVRRGVIIKPQACSECGAPHERIQAHHEDYDKPLEVVWLCPGCHGKRHAAA